jgi:hypothetical protein
MPERQHLHNLQHGGALVAHSVDSMHPRQEKYASSASFS